MPKILVIDTMKYEFRDRETGEMVSGSKAYSFYRENGKFIPLKTTFKRTSEAENLFPKPGIYEVELGFRGSIECAVLVEELNLDYYF